MQALFLAALYADAAAPSALAEEMIVRSDALSVAARLAVYRNNLRANFHSVMALEFPVVQQLSGADYFRQLAWEFQRSHPSRSGNLQHIGAAFPAWLTEQLAATAYAWFGDVAALEWAWQESYVAPEPASRADFSKLAVLSAAQQESLQFTFVPSCRLLQSRWPVLSIWRAHQELAATSGVSLEQVDLQAHENVLVLRTANAVQLHPLQDAEAALLQSLRAQQGLGAAIEAAGLIDAGFDAAAALQRAASLGVFADLRIAQHP